VAPSPRLPSLGRRGEGWVAVQIALVALVLLCELLGPGWPPTVAPLLDAAGVALLAVGSALFLAGIGSLGRSLTPCPRPRDDGTLREGGAYRLVRHPMYGGVLLAAAGWSLMRTPIGLAMTLLAGAFLELKTRREEAWLLERFPRYEAYRQRVRRKFVPGIL